MLDTTNKNHVRVTNSNRQRMLEWIEWYKKEKQKCQKTKK